MQARRFLLLSVSALFLVFTGACENREHLVGKYQTAIDVNGESQTILLELMANGQGSWSGQEDNITFKWESKEDEIWLHTKSGGLIVAKIVGENIEIDLAGAGLYRFKKIER